jgi:DNA-binding HxlR family transcriptional regulator
MCLAVGESALEWTLLVILAPSSASMRFNALQRAVAGISHRMLTVILRKMERDGLVLSATHTGMSPHTSYELTPLGISFIDPVMAVDNWAIGAQPQIERNRELFAH